MLSSLTRPKGETIAAKAGINGTALEVGLIV
jgi:hypothetical protein